MKKKTSLKKLDLKKKVVGTLNQPAAIHGGLRQAEQGAGTRTYELTACGMTCWSYGNYCFLSENCV